MKKIVLFVLLTLFWIFVLFPRDFLWNSAKNELNKKGISLTTKEVDISLYMLYNQIKIKDLVVLNSFKASNLGVLYDVRDPLHVSFDGNSSYGVFDGKIALKDKKGFVIIRTKRVTDSILKEYFKKTKGGYKYEFDY